MPKRVRRKMVKFTITEISCVDRPAVEGALATLIKRDTRPVEPPKQSRSQYAFVDSPELQALAKRLDAAAEARERREREQEAKAMQTDRDEADHDTRKGIADARTSMDEAIAKRAPGVSRYTAMETWRRSHPVEFAKLQASPTVQPAPIAKREHTDFFARLTDQIQKRDNCPRTVAMERARIENPSAFARLQGA